MEIGDKTEGKEFDFFLSKKLAHCWIFRIRNKAGEHKGSVTVYAKQMAVITVQLEPKEYIDLHVAVFEFFINLEINVDKSS